MSKEREEYLEALGARFVKCLQMIEVKSADYATETNPFVNFETAAGVVGITVEQGILYHVVNKVVRIVNLLEKDPDVVGESLEDSIDDGINYFNILGAYRNRATSSRDSGVVGDFEVPEEIGVEVPVENKVASWFADLFTKGGGN